MISGKKRGKRQAHIFRGKADSDDMKSYLCGITAVFFSASLAFGDVHIDPIRDNTMTAQNATILYAAGAVSRERQRNIYPFKPAIDGSYRFEISGLKNNARVTISIFNGGDELIAASAGAGNGQGITMPEMTGGQTYRIQVGRYSGISSYILSIGCQKEPVDLSRLTGLEDSIQYTDQRNVYLFTAPADGSYRFEIAGLKNTAKLNLCARDAEGYPIRYAAGIGNGKGFTLNGVIKGEPYQIEVGQSSGFGDYTLIIGRQKEPADIGLDAVYDSIQYTDQRNVYLFTASADGRYRFEISGLKRNAKVSVYAYTLGGETIQFTAGAGNGHGLTLGLAGGETYQIQVRYHSGFSGYAIKAMKQSP
jgi:hypothetical protein